MAKALLIIAGQVVMYLFAAFIAWDWLWWNELHNLQAIDRGSLAFIWAGSSTAVTGLITLIVYG